MVLPGIPTTSGVRRQKVTPALPGPYQERFYSIRRVVYGMVADSVHDNLSGDATITEGLTIREGDCGNLNLIAIRGQLKLANEYHCYEYSNQL